MTLKKQSIRHNMSVYADGEPIEKEELIATSESWSEGQVNVFKKFLRQGVTEFKIKGVTYKVVLKERSDINSAGDKPIKVPPIPGERTF